MQKLLSFLWIALCCLPLQAQEAFYIENYDVQIHLDQHGVLDVVETLDVFFTEERHGIIRSMPFRYYAANDVELAEAFARALNRSGEDFSIYYTNIEVDGWEYRISTEGDYKNIRIGSEDKLVEGKQRYVIRYKVYNVLNFFENRSELYWNVIGDQWNTSINAVSVKISWDQPLPVAYIPETFVATGRYASTATNATRELSANRRSLVGKTTTTLQANEAFTIGIAFPKDFFQLKPVPVEVLAEKFYIKNQDVQIKLADNGVAQIRERYTLVPVRHMERIYRYLYPFLQNQPSSAKDWLGGQSRYLVSHVEVKGGKKRGNTIIFDISDVAVGEEHTVELSYQTFGNIEQQADAGRYRFAYIPFNEGVDEPVLKSNVEVELPEKDAQSFDLQVSIRNKDGAFVRDARIRKLNDHTLAADLGSAAQALLPKEKLQFELIVPPSYATVGTGGTKARLFWANNRFLFLPILVFLGLYYAWNRWGRDEDFSKMVHYYPPENLPPSEAGILIDDKLHDRDLLALIPYWGGKGLIEVEEVGTDSIWKKDDYIFKFKKALPANAPEYERTMFVGIFGKNPEAGDTVKLSSLKNVFYTTMDSARKQLEKEIKRKSLYVPYTRGAGVLLLVLGIAALGVGGFFFVATRLGAMNVFSPELGLGLLGTGILSFIFGRIMPKKAPIGLAAYKALAGFELFVKDAELPRLETFLKEDPHYFDKTLPYAIVFNHVEKWAKKFEALSVPPPSWYHSPHGSTFSTWAFTNNLSHAMQTAGSTFASRPSSSSGGSFGGGGGFSGGGFGGGGGSSW